MLKLYRGILRGARRMPTKNRRQYIEAKARAEFKAGATETRPERIAFHIALAETSLETVRTQAEHLGRAWGGGAAEDSDGY